MIEAQGGSMLGRQQTYNRQKGAVSLFVVMFTAMLFTAVTVGFTVLMLSDQQQSTDNDLAQSALDSAYAGAEDAKRVLAEYTDCAERGLSNSRCAAIVDAIAISKCDTIQSAMGVVGANGERPIRTEEGDDALAQAYTCVKIKPNTDDYIGTTRTGGDIRLIPLKTVGDEAVTKVKIQWLTKEDLTVGTNVDLDHETRIGTGTPPQPSTVELPTKEEWGEASKGAILRVGSIQYRPGGVDIDEIDSQARAIFLYPYDNTAGFVDMPNSHDLGNSLVDDHKPLDLENLEIGEEAYPNSPKESTCSKENSRTYLCETILTLPPGGNDFSRYITVASLYRNTTSFRVTLYGDDDNPIKFRNVQPEVDVTGRANDVFRRIVSRVESADASEAPYPRAALGSLGDICKNYLITDDPDDYRYLSEGGCTESSDSTSPPPASFITNPEG